MTIDEVRGLRECLEKYQEKKIEFIPMFTHVLLDMLNAYEDEIKSLEDQLEAADHDAIHGEERD